MIFFFFRPRLQTIDGHLYIYGAKDKNVSLVISKNGYLNVNGDNLYRVVRDAKQASSAILNLKYTSLTKLEEDFKYFGLQIDQLTQRLNVCESAIGSWQGVGFS